MQHFVPAIATDPTDVINFNLHQSKLDIFGAANDRWNQKTERNIKSAWFVINELLKKNETSCNYKNVESVFNDITNDYKAFNGMSYELIDRHQGLILNKANSPDPIINNYYSNVMRP
ncbi:hypothetical protein SDC9_156146 [bioreactor metagenome]|uniref:Uncharacterized protein n=1 Tax=bioreactor metagenome TaxID=1076179 RepID=A0A645F4S7_9ZZZZ